MQTAPATEDAARWEGWGTALKPAHEPIVVACAKAPRSERTRLPDGTGWPCVKPVTLMRWLVRLVTPPGGLVLDPFAGTGPTGQACAAEGLSCVLADNDPKAIEHGRIRLARIRAALF
jgi:hypothetical protein